MRRGFLNNKKMKAAPLYPEHAEKIRVIPKGLQGEGLSSFFKKRNARIFIRVPAQNIIERVLMDEKLLKYHTGVQEKKVSGTTPNRVPM